MPQGNTFYGQNSLSQLFVPIVEVTGRSTRLSKSKSFKIPKTRTKLCQNAFDVTGPGLWNNLPTELKLNDNYNSFKREISKKSL